MSNNNSGGKGPIAWMADNHVAANFLMIFLLLGGLYAGMEMKQEVFPEFELDQVVVSVAYPGASPEEVEQAIVLPIEEAIASVDGIEEVTAVAGEGNGKVTVEALLDADVQKLANDIKDEIDRISSFPEEAEEPQITVPSRKRQVITLIVHGHQEAGVLREATEMIRDQLLQDEQISQVELLGAKPLEMSIEVSQENLRRYNLTLVEIAEKIRRSSLDLPGGGIKTKGGEILVRMKERRDYAAEFGRIPIISAPSGTLVSLADIALIKDTFEETDQFLVYDGMPALGIEVYRVGDQTPISVADAVQAHVSRLRSVLPEGVSVATVNDRSDMFKQRRDLLLRNGYFGLVLVFLLLGLFLQPKLAFWVTMGIPISFLGSLLVIPGMGVSINMVSLFAFIIALGIVVDDAIIVGENIYSHKQRGLGNFAAAIEGTREIAVPVTFSIITNVVTFLPLYFVPGTMGKIFRCIPVVVVSVFLISLVEALFVLPAHLGHQRPSRNRFLLWFGRQQDAFADSFSRLVRSVYGPTLRLSMRFRYVTVTLAVVTLLIIIGYVKSGRVGVIMFDRLEADFSSASVTLPVGVPVEQTIAVHDKILRVAKSLVAETGGERQSSGILSYVDRNTSWIRVFMTPADERPLSTREFTQQWRQRIGGIAGVENLRFRSDEGGPGSGSSVTVELSHRDTEMLERASAELAESVSFFSVVSDIDDGFTPGKEQLDFRLKPAGYRLGLTPAAVAGQVRNAFYGNEVFTQLRGRNEIKIMVRNPAPERRAEYYLDEMLVSTPAGGKVPLHEVVEVQRGKAYTSINRRDGRRVMSVTCDVVPLDQTELVLNSIKQEALPALVAKYPGLGYGFEGRQSEQRESMAALGKGMIVALLIIYVLLAIPFRSYIQPAIIMVAIPFGVVGAIIGHFLLGYSLSILSMFGIVALCGVVVNDSLVLIDFANREVRSGATAYAAIVNAGIQRFRPIMLTTLTTFFGLMPMILETSRQARFLIPMAISLGFGILFSTFIVLALVPALYIIVDDFKNFSGKIWPGKGQSPTL